MTDGLRLGPLAVGHEPQVQVTDPTWPSGDLGIAPPPCDLVDEPHGGVGRLPRPRRTLRVSHALRHTIEAVGPEGPDERRVAQADLLLHAT
jgi:hypothetical protein